MKMLSLLLVLALFSCSRQPLKPEQQKALDAVATVSFLGNVIHVDVVKKSILRKTDRVYSIPNWQLDETFHSMINEALKERSKRRVDLKVDVSSLALAAKEKRKTKLMETLFASAESAGAKYLFLALPEDRQDDFPLHRGVVGVHCFDRVVKKTKATPYFLFQFAVWDVKTKKKIFETSVDPEVTAGLPFAECKTVAELKDPVKELESPVKQALGMVVDALFSKMGWAKTY